MVATVLGLVGALCVAGGDVSLLGMSSSRPTEPKVLALGNPTSPKRVTGNDGEQGRPYPPCLPLPCLRCRLPASQEDNSGAHTQGTLQGQCKAIVRETLLRPHLAWPPLLACPPSPLPYW